MNWRTRVEQDQHGRRYLVYPWWHSLALSSGFRILLALTAITSSILALILA